MNKRIIVCLTAALAAMAACKAPSEPEITPPQPVFVDTTQPPNPIDHRIYADAGLQDAIDIEWKPDSSGNTTGYVLFRSINDSTVGTDGLLVNRTTVAHLESTDPLFDQLPTFFKDTTGIVAGATYYYQLQAFFRTPTNQLNYSVPTHVDVTTSFKYAQRVRLLSPNTNGTDTLHALPLKFLWQDPNSGGRYQIIVQRLDSFDYLWSYIDEDYGSLLTKEYPTSAPPLMSGIPYQWRVKWLDTYGGSSSPWMTFSVLP